MSQGRNNIVSEFYLVNTNKQWLIKNFQFIQAFFAGAEWLHMKHCVVRPPNVYHVLCPGRFQIYWAAMDIDVTFEGKLRKHQEASKELSKYSKAIDENMLWPEAWKVRVEIKDLTPNNFNLYAEYYQRGFKAEEIKSLENYVGITDAIKELTNYVGNLAKNIKDSAGQAMNEVKNAVGLLQTQIKDNLGNGLTGKKSVSERYADAEREWLAVRGTNDPTHGQKWEAYRAALKDKIKQEREAQGLSVTDEELNEALAERMGGETTSQKTIRERREAEERARRQREENLRRQQMYRSYNYGYGGYGGYPYYY
jgi:hypothetical protein